MKKYLLGVAFLVGLLSFMACNDISILSPPGPAGPDGKSAYDVWVDAVTNGDIEWTAGTDVSNYFKYLKGEPGESAYDTWVQYISSGVVADPHNPNMYWNPARNSVPDFYYFLSGADGDDAPIPFINGNGNWQIGNTDTGIKARGDDGADGADGKDGSVVRIENGFWYIDGINTNVPATGPQGEQGEQGEPGADGQPGADGADGTDGQSAYQIWVTEVGRGDVMAPDGDPWPGNQITLEDFWNYVRGKTPDGTDPAPITVERTLLQFDRSERAGDYEEFVFATDPGAVVTINHEDETVSETADDTGTCVIQFPNSPTREFYAVAYAQADGKLVSYPVTVRVPIRASGYTLEVYYDQTRWFALDGTERDNSTDTYGTWSTSHIGTEEVPFLIMRRTQPGYVRIPFSTENIAYVLVSEESGLGQFYVRAIPRTPGDYSTGQIEVRMTQLADGVIGYTDIHIVAMTNQDRPVITMILRATNQ